MSKAKAATELPTKLFVAVPLEGLADTLVSGITTCLLSEKKKQARSVSGGKRKSSAIVTIRVRDAERDGVAFQRVEGGWEPVGSLEPHHLICRDDRALGRLNAHRKTSAGGLLISSIDVPRVLLMYRVHGDKDAWKTPKGGVERGESKRRAAKREVAEESGLTQVKIVGSLGTMQYFKYEKDRLREKTVHLFLMLNKEGESGIAPGEGERYVSGEWLPFDDAIARVTQKQARAVIARAQDLLAKRAKDDA
jgi:8-oxo-dGTP pyrophosphatase MutT (NUDIX family)